MYWVCQLCGNISLELEKPTSCSGNSNALGCDGGNWKKQHKIIKTVQKQNKWKRIEYINKCPHCGDDFGYYIRQRVTGIIHDNTLFETREPYNTDMHDPVNYKTIGNYYYCMNCNKKITKINI